MIRPREHRDTNDVAASVYTTTGHLGSSRPEAIGPRLQELAMVGIVGAIHKWILNSCENFLLYSFFQRATNQLIWSVLVENDSF